MTSHALVYARASSDPSDLRISVDRQLKLCTAKAADLWPGAEVRVFRDDSIKASDPDVYRPGYAAFLTAVRTARKGELVGIVVNEQSRLTRQGTGAWDELVVTLTKAGLGKVETLNAGPVSVAPGSRLVGRVMAVVDAEEVERLKLRVQAAHADLFVEGRPSGRAPFGYRSVKGDDGRPALVHDPVEGPVVKQVFEWALQGHAISAIVDKLNADGIAPRSARWRFKDGRQMTGWKPVSVRSLLTSPSVAGLRAHTDSDGITHTVPARWPALIDESQWRTVQRVLDRPAVVTGADGRTFRVRTKPAPKARKYLLSGGVLRCGRCGTRMTAQTQSRRNGTRVAAYQCDYAKGGPGCGGVSISPADEVERIVVEAIQTGLSASPGLRQRLNAVEDSEAGRWREERDAAKGRMLTAAEMFGTGAIDRDEFDVMQLPAKAARDFAQARLDAMTSDTTLPSATDVGERWDGLTLRQKRAVVERLIAEIVVHPGVGLGRIGEPKWLV